MNTWIVLFLVFDILVMLGIVLFVFRLRVKVGTVVLPTASSLEELSQIRPLMEFAKDRQERIADYVRSNWSGVPDQLPGVLSSLVDQLEGEARAQGHTFSRDLLKTLVATTLRSRRISRPDDVGIALEKVA